MIEAIILDFGGVLFKNKDEYDGPKGSLNVDPDLWHRAGLGLVDDDEVYSDIARNHGVTSEEVQKWLFSKREPNQELLDLLERLKPEIKIAVLNNGLRSLFRGFIEKYNLEDRFDLLMNSAEEGIKKPDPEIYQRAVQRLAVTPENCLLVDDDQNNIDGAIAIGMEGILFLGIEDLEKGLTKRGILQK